jgi:hypothetical protein
MQLDSWPHPPFIRRGPHAVAAENLPDHGACTRVQADLNLLAEQMQTPSFFKRRPRAAAPLPGAHQESG